MHADRLWCGSYSLCVARHVSWKAGGQRRWLEPDGGHAPAAITNASASDGASTWLIPPISHTAIGAPPAPPKPKPAVDPTPPAAQPKAAPAVTPAEIEPGLQPKAGAALPVHVPPTGN